MPFDAHPHPDLIANGGLRPQDSQIASLNYLFETSVGDDLIRGAVLAPGKLSASVKDAFGSPATAAMGVIAVPGIFVSAVWLALRIARKGQRKAPRHRGYTRLQGGVREEMLRTYRRAEKLLGRRGVSRRATHQTLGEYGRVAGYHAQDIAEQVAWFVTMARSAAYNPSWADSDEAPGALEEARVRLASLRAALG